MASETPTSTVAMFFGTKAIDVDASQVRKAVEVLILRSAWFQFTLLPDDKYRIEFKPENDAAVRQAIEARQ